jgi:hypothetical protein
MAAPPPAAVLDATVSFISPVRATVVTVPPASSTSASAEPATMLFRRLIVAV